MPKASGVYVHVWSNDAEIRKNVLKQTSGGDSHITLFYSGKILTVKELQKAASAVISDVPRTATITDCYVNSFMNGKTEKTRHDILMVVDEETNIWVEHMRRNIIGKHFATSGVCMGKPHITHAIDLPDLETANRVCNNLKKLISNDGIIVQLNGVTLD